MKTICRSLLCCTVLVLCFSIGQSQADVPLVATASQPTNTHLSHWALSLDVGYGVDNTFPQLSRAIRQNDPMGQNSTNYSFLLPFGSVTRGLLPMRLGVSYVLAQPCQSSNQGVCVDVSLYGQLIYQYMHQYSYSHSSIGGQLGVETAIYFTSRRSVAWMSQVGLGYSFFTYQKVYSEGDGIDGGRVWLAYLGQQDGIYDVADVIQHRFTFSFSTGMLFQIPNIKHLSLYALATVTTTLAMLTPLYGPSYVSIQVAPGIGIRYRF